MNRSPAADKPKRYPELDSLRGLAALTVLFHHFLLFFPVFWDASKPEGTPWWVRLVAFSPLHILWAGYEAVAFFFVLSGFVLALPYFGSGPAPPYRLYVLKRILRLYPPYIVAVLVAFMLRQTLYHGDVAGASWWFNEYWKRDPSWASFFSHAAMIGSFRSSDYDPVLWSLVLEMRISLIFPLLAWLVLHREKWSIVLAVCLLPANSLMNHFNATGLIHWDNDYAATLQYSAMFIAGALLAKKHQAAARYWTSFSKAAKIFLLLAAVLAYTNYFWLSRYMPSHFSTLAAALRKQPVSDLMVIFGVGVFIIASLAARRLSAFLCHGPVHFLGQISYSLYLYHALCLKAGIILLLPHMPIWLVLPICLVAGLAVAAISHRFIEVPTMNLGKKLTRHFAANKIGQRSLEGRLGAAGDAQ